MCTCMCTCTWIVLKPIQRDIDVLYMIGDGLWRVEKTEVNISSLLPCSEYVCMLDDEMLMRFLGTSTSSIVSPLHLFFFRFFVFLGLSKSIRLI